MTWGYPPQRDIAIKTAPASTGPWGRSEIPIDLDKRLARRKRPSSTPGLGMSIQLYHLGLGAGADPMDARELSYLVDATLPRVLPRRSATSRSSLHDRAARGAQRQIELSKVLRTPRGRNAPGAILIQRNRQSRCSAHRDLGQGAGRRHRESQVR